MTARPISQVPPLRPADFDREQRLELAIAEYLEGVRAGQPADRAIILARHPDLAADLASFFADEDRVMGLAQSVFARPCSDSAGVPGNVSGTDSADLRLNPGAD